MQVASDVLRPARDPLVVLLGAGFSDLLARLDRGIFGFHLTFSSGLAWTVLIVEGAGVVMLLLIAPSSGSGGSAAPNRMPAGG
jgi:hypothetical protein